MPIPPVAGPMTHARQALGDEPVLWAAFASSIKFDVRGLDADGRKKHNVALRVLDSVASATADGPGEGNNSVAGAGPTCVNVFSPKNGAALRYARTMVPEKEEPFNGEAGPFLWALTPHRLHIAKRIDQAAGTPGPSLREAVTSVFSSEERRPVAMKPLRPVTDIPRSEIAGFTLARYRRAPCLRMELTDGSGFDLVFRGCAPHGTDGEPDQYERLLALSLGRSDPWT